MNTTAGLVNQALHFFLKFDSRWMDFLQWLNNFEFIVDFLYITDDRKVDFFLNMVEPWVLIKIQNEFAPFDPFKIQYELLISVLEKMFSYYHGEFAAQHRFNCRDQIFGESVKHYAITLEKLLSQCNSDINTEVNLLKRFIKGVRNNEAKTRLLKQQYDISFDEALKIAQTFENKEWILYIETLRRYQKQQTIEE